MTDLALNSYKLQTNFTIFAEAEPGGGCFQAGLVTVRALELSFAIGVLWKEVFSVLTKKVLQFTLLNELIETIPSPIGPNKSPISQ